MPLLVGIDEAGYGPNLGPLVMSAVACRLPPEKVKDDLWHVLRHGVRRKSDKDDGRLLIDDSKLVYASGKGLAKLEEAVFAILRHPGKDFLTIEELLDQLEIAFHGDLHRERWYQGNSDLPLQVKDWQNSWVKLDKVVRQQDLEWGGVRCLVVCPPRFNQILERSGSKAAVLALGLTELLQSYLGEPEGESLIFVIDKHGGRNHYSSMLQQATAGGLVAVQEETPARSVYQVVGLSRPMEVTFQAQADAQHLCVALASMVSKYLRELLMHDFNRFWQGHVPGLQATAGYPVDAARFLADIRPVLGRLGIQESELWRSK